MNSSSEIKTEIMAAWRESAKQMYLNAGIVAYRFMPLALVVLGIGVLLFGLSQDSFAQMSDFQKTHRLREMNARMLNLGEGNLGALAMTCAGIYCLFQSAMGRHNAAFGVGFIIMVAFVVRSVMTIFFETDVELPDGL